MVQKGDRDCELFRGYLEIFEPPPTNPAFSVDTLRRNQHFFRLPLGNGGSKMKKCRFPILQNHQKTLEINVFEQIKSLGTFAKLKSGSKTFSFFQKSAKNTKKLLKSALLRWGFKNSFFEKVDSTKVLCDQKFKNHEKTSSSCHSLGGDLIF